MGDPLLSVLLPCRDADAFLPDAIASLATQSFTDFEVIAVDDGSADDTLNLLVDWAAADPRVHVVPGNGAGLVAALQTAGNRATGSVLGRMDADDIAHPSRFERQLRLMEETGVAVCGTRVRYFPPSAVYGGARRYERWINKLTEPTTIARDMFVECPIPHPTLMLTRDAYESVGGYRDAGWPEDYDLILRLWAAGYPMAKTREVLLQWRERPERASRIDPRYSPDAFRRCKVHWLRTALLAPSRPVAVWGAGPVGKAFALELERQGGQLAGFVDLDRRKIGQQIHGAPVVAPHAIDKLGDAFFVAAVGSATAREEIRHVLAASGRVEMKDFCAVA